MWWSDEGGAAFRFGELENESDVNFSGAKPGRRKQGRARAGYKSEVIWERRWCGLGPKPTAIFKKVPIGARRAFQ